MLHKGGVERFDLDVRLIESSTGTDAAESMRGGVQFRMRAPRNRRASYEPTGEMPDDLGCLLRASLELA
jgi:hypothetical protein